jgi:hypothetical protein
VRNRIVPFLLRAKQATYAGHGAEESPSRPGSHDLRYAEGPLLYLDTYLGSLRFAGEEAVWENGVALWAMNYSGRVLEPATFSGDFLKAALSAVPADAPFRGPALFQEAGYVYRCAVEGDFPWFSGREVIEKDGALLYECLFHGGSIVH